MLKSLIENECAGQNSLVRLASHFTNANESNAVRNLRSIDLGSQLSGESLVDEYLSMEHQTRVEAPRTFHMENLFNEIKCIDKTHQANTCSVNNQDWSRDIMWESIKKQKVNNAKEFQWSTEYLAQNESNILDETWENMMVKNAKNPNETFIHNSISNGFVKNNDSLIATNQLNEEMKKTVNELLDSMQDSRFSETEFLQFVRNLSTNGLTNTDSNQLSSKQIDSDFALFDSIIKEENLGFEKSQDLASDWVNEFQNLEQSLSSVTSSHNQENSYWNDLQDEWNAIASENPDQSWLEDFQKVFDSYRTYEFDKQNPLTMHPNPFEEGLERLKTHDIVNAVLLFEVAVQKEPENALAWEYLGRTQVENEQDPQAIRALRKCLELKADNLLALSTLATSYTNESMQRLAFDSLVKWVQNHPVYSHLLKNDPQADRLVKSSEQFKYMSLNPYYMTQLSIVNANDFMDLQEIYLKAVRESALGPNQIDPDLQCCLGILFHLSGEYDKAADCFKTALQVKPNDHLLWNKLGATYANNNRNEEAIDAYYQALKLCPGFVRARYNLGIGCMNLGAYKEAVEHFLTALHQQSQANIGQNTKQKNQQMSDTIWSTLRLALSNLNRTDLYQACINKDLDQLKKEYNI